MKLFLGLVPGLVPYKIPEIAKKMKEIGAGIIFSYYTYQKQIEKIVEQGLHDYFDFDGPIMIDSGAYSAMNSGATISLAKYSMFLKRIDTRDDDVFVNLDKIGDDIQSLDNYKWLKTVIDNPNGTLMPVTHYPSTFLYHNDYVGLGGAVPSLKINQKGSVYDVANWIRQFLNKCKNSGLDPKIHGFGIGSPYHQIAFENVLHSVDWMGWRRNASYCCVYTPEGSRYIIKARKIDPRGKELSIEECEKYRPPFIEYPDLMNWDRRAVWNVWQFLTAHEYRDKMITSTYVKSIKKRLENEN